MDLLTLRTELETALVDLLGEYTLANGARTPALSVRSMGETLPAGTSVKGLEVIILRDPNLNFVRKYIREEAWRLWTVYMVDWAASGLLEQAVEIAMRVFPDSRVLSLNVPEGMGPYAQRRLTIRTPL